MTGKILKFSTATITAANAGFRQPSFYGCDLQLRWSNFSGPIELMSKDGEFHSLP